MSSHPHYFIAVPLSSSIKDWLFLQQSQCKDLDALSYKSWTHKEDLHITLKFLGAVTPEKIDLLVNKLVQLQSKFEPFQLKVGGLGNFGNPKQPRVLWTGVESNDRLNQLYKTIEDVCVEVGFSEENRPYRPHITLAKKWNGSRLPEDYMSELAASFKGERQDWIDHFVVYEIHPSQSPKYKVIKQIYLK